MKCLLAVACALTMVTARADEHGETEKEIALEDAPAEVQAAINAFMSLLPERSELDELTEEKEDGSIVYEAEIELFNGDEYEVEFNALGKIVEIEGED
jgi:hypothetical protein